MTSQLSSSVKSLSIPIGDLVSWVLLGTLILLAIAVVSPFIWMLSVSFKSPGEIFSAKLNLWPSQFTGGLHYLAALSKVPLLRFMLNGVIVCGGILLVQIAISIPAAYALVNLPFRGSSLFFQCTLVCLSIPIQVIALPLFLGLSFANLLNSYFSMMLPYFLSVFAIFYFRQAFKTFPDDIIHAARLDGLGEMEIVWRIVLPAHKQALAAFCIFSVVAHWNDLYWPMIVISKTELAPPPLGMMFFATAETGSDYGALMAGALLLTAPLVICFLLARKQFIQALTLLSKS